MYTIHGTIIHLSPNKVSTYANPLEWPSTYFLVYMFSQILWDCQYQNTTMRKRRIQSADIASYINIVSELKGVTDSPGHSQEVFIVRISARAQTDRRQHKAAIFRTEDVHVISRHCCCYGMETYFMKIDASPVVRLELLIVRIT